MFHPEGPSFYELAVQALSSTQRGYDLLAPKFDVTPFRTSAMILDACAEAVAPAERMLDVCCGTGAAMRSFRPRVKDSVTGVDFSAGMLAEARQRSATWPGSAATRFVRADARAMPFERAFDLATCFGALGHIVPEDHVRFVEETRRALVPGGRFVFVTGHKPPPTSPACWLAHGFNLAMRIRNAIVKPPFVMYYLMFLLPEVEFLLEDHGFEVEVVSGLFTEKFEYLSGLEMVVATRKR